MHQLVNAKNGLSLWPKKDITMGCDELRRLLLDTDWQGNESVSSGVVAHIQTCPNCRHGLVRLEADLFLDDVDESGLLSCEQCRSRFPDYYEATRPDHPLVNMPAGEVAQMAYHLSHCASCNEEYQEFVLLSELEERDEMTDP
jgi:hypothetical protein